MSWIKDFREFANETSAHGVKNIFEGPNKVILISNVIIYILVVYQFQIILYKV